MFCRRCNHILQQAFEAQIGGLGIGHRRPCRGWIVCVGALGLAYGVLGMMHTIVGLLYGFGPLAELRAEHIAVKWRKTLCERFETAPDAAYEHRAP